jgi:hypothetical protein
MDSKKLLSLVTELNRVLWESEEQLRSRHPLAEGRPHERGLRRDSMPRPFLSNCEALVPGAILALVYAVTGAGEGAHAISLVIRLQ